jgi:hypothetical protein
MSLLDPSDKAVADAERVKLHLDAEELVATAYAGERSVKHISFRRISCVAGELVIKDPGSGGINDGGVFAASRIRLHIGRSVDGALIIHRTELTAGIVLMIPLVANYRTWYRFPSSAEGT